MKEEQLSPLDRMYLRSLMLQHYGKESQSGHPNKLKTFRDEQKAKDEGYKDSTTSKDFLRGAPKPAAASAAFGALGGAIGGGFSGKGWRGALSQALKGSGYAGLAGGLAGGITNSFEGSRSRKFQASPKTVRNKTKELFDQDNASGSYDRARDVSQASSGAVMAGLASQPLRAMLNMSLPKIHENLDRLTPQDLNAMSEHLNLTGEKKPRLYHTQDDGKVGKNLPQKERGSLFTDSAYHVKPEEGVHGGVGFSSQRMMSTSATAHELGHSNIHHHGKVTKFLQDKVYPKLQGGGQLSALYGVLPTALTSYATKDDTSETMGAAKGALIGAAAHAPLLIPEFEASRRGIGALKRTSLSGRSKLMSALAMVPSFGSYALSSMLPSAGAGAYNVYKNNKRKEQLSGPPS